MRVRFRWLLPIAHAAIGGILVVLVCGCRTNVSPPVAVEYWHTGDDSLSQKLQVAVESAFRESTDFRLTPTDIVGRRLIVWTMRNVEGELVGDRTKATYTVRFSSLDDNASRNPDLQQRLSLAMEISTQRGSCWESEMSRCAAQILSATGTAARKVQ
jgi:hypothetical protein